MKKFINVVLVLILTVVGMVGLTGCQEGKEFKIGVICLHGNDSTYDKNFIDAVYRALDNLGLDESNIELATNIGEDNACYEKACELAESCDVVFADSFGHETFIMQAAKKYPDVNFCHATGNQAHTSDLDNFSNAFASIYEGRYLAGIAAGMKINEMIANGTKVKGVTITANNAKIGYVGAYDYAEVKSGYTAFYLGAKSVCPTVTMEVKYTSSWFDESLEKNAANALIEDGCCLISQHADSYGAPNACETAGVPNVTYNGTTASKCPNTYVVSSRINWTPYFEYIINQTREGKKIDKDWTGTLATGSVELDACGTCAAAGTQEAINAAKKQLMDGTVKVFDTTKFTVGGQTLTTYLADVNYDEKFTPDTEVIKDGVFQESVLRSAPYFDIVIDGITEVIDK